MSLLIEKENYGLQFAGKYIVNKLKLAQFCLSHPNTKVLATYRKDMFHKMLVVILGGIISTIVLSVLFWVFQIFHDRKELFLKSGKGYLKHTW